VRVLRSYEMTANGSECVGPPMTGWDEQQDRNKNRVRGEKERNLAIGETKYPGDLRGKIVAGAAHQNPEHCAAKGLRSFLLPFANVLRPRVEEGIRAATDI